MIAVDQIEPAVAQESSAEMVWKIARFDRQSQARSDQDIDERETDRQAAPFFHHVHQIAVRGMMVIVARAGEPDVLEEEARQPDRIRAACLARERLRERL